jgi:hypothetical protein
VSLLEVIGSINWLAVLIAWVVTVVIGIVWYRPRVFGTAWAGSVNRWTGISTRDLLQPPDSTLKLGYWAAAFGLNVLGMALLLAALNASTLGDAVQVALLTTVGFAASLLSWPVIFAGMPITVLFINSAAFMTMQLVNAAILVSIV